MSSLASIVEIDRRFARSARLDADLNGTPPLVGYVLQASIEKSLTTLASSQIDSKQGAFTWTGPYGGGKSSAALLVANLVAGIPENRAIARKIAGPSLAGIFQKAFPEKLGPWAVVAVTGSRMGLRQAIADACLVTFGWSKAAHTRAVVSDDALIDALQASTIAGRSGALVVLDELGKLLEHEALEGGDIHLLQDIAERAARSHGRLVVLGILHQGFDQYAARASRDSRQEWVKVQGRYQDIPFLAGADETVALLGRAIRCTKRPASASVSATAVAEAIGKRRPTDEQVLAAALTATWPLNPVTALLLGPVSRQRFAQNERSVFGFLSSAEPSGFQEHLDRSEDGTTYGPDQLWDYLASNFGMALASGVDGSRFSLAFEAIERAGAKGGPLHVRLTKSAAAIEFFRNGSGLALADDILAAATPNASEKERKAAIADLVDWAVLIRQSRLKGYALFAGSDFDLDDAINKATAPLSAEQLLVLPQRVGLGFAAAKRHYFRTGALRTFEVVIHLTGEADTPPAIADTIASRRTRGSGSLVLLLGDGTINGGEVERRCKAVAKALGKANVVAAVGGATDAYALRSSAAELFAIERVFREHPQLEGDRIARREIAARRSAGIDIVHRDLEAGLANARWWLAPEPTTGLREPLAIVATALADAAYFNTPILQSELLQRDRPSSSAMAALRELCHAMVAHADQADLGFEGFPAEMGLYMTILAPFGVHGEIGSGVYGFRVPATHGDGKSLWPAWNVIEAATDITLDEIYRIWAAPPFGIKAGVMPVLALASLIVNSDRLAIYIDGVFQTGLNDVVVDKFLQKPNEVRLRRVDRSVLQAAFLGGLAQKFDIIDGTATLLVAQALFRRYEKLTIYAKRTETLGDVAQKVRRVVLKSRDPEALLFEDLPNVLDDSPSAQTVYDALLEAEGAYQSLLDRLHKALARSLAVDASTFAGLSERAASIKNLTNDYAFEGFAMRAAAFESGDGDIEGVASLLLHKPAHQWSDRDREQALLQLARFGRQFRELEALAVVRDRRSNTEALALVVGVDPKTAPLFRSFILTEVEKVEATALADQLLETLARDSAHGRIQFAALARAVASLAADSDIEIA
ncbi:hypothetical protein [Mesorhizobium sp. LNHC229A00]|uniref:hypothetical protein n=1 Tax=Mesorhizobium sp. LNHC229A00 TaxID=1287240 RepID=UPI0003CF404F|nr:hypothetical protein [Mesorhizobium sp. LNHC229A00]ESY94890.1 ATP-binding protein [Mesorhizobium sp. LNHC229A00]